MTSAAALRVADDALQTQQRARNVGRFGRQPAEAWPVGHHRGERLIDLMGDEARNLAHGRNPIARVSRARVLRKASSMFSRSCMSMNKPYQCVGRPSPSSLSWPID